MIFNHAENEGENELGGWETRGNSVRRSKRMREAKGK